MALTEEMNTARKKLFEKLGDATKQYCQLMKQWFSMKMTKDEFDAAVRAMMNAEQTKCHNEFLLCLFNKCNYLTSDSARARYNSKKAKLAKQKRGDKNAFQPADPVNYLPQLEAPPQHLQEEAQRYCVQELFLPDQSMVMGRLMLGAWELGMEGADDVAAEYIVIAVQFFLKNILTAILTQRNGYKVRDKRIIHSVGCPVPNPWLRNSISAKDTSQESPMLLMENDDDVWHVPRPPRTAAEIEQEYVYQLACATTSTTNFQPKAPITPYDVLQGLLVHKTTIPAHSLYAVNIEKIINTISHPSWEEADAISKIKSCAR